MYDIVTIGSAARDVFLEGPVFHITPDRASATGTSLKLPVGSKLEVSNIEFATGGGATNAAVTFARRGLRTACVAAVGNDPGGSEIRQELKRERVDSRHIKTANGMHTAYSVIILAGNGERTVLVYRGANELFRPRDIAWDMLNARWWYIVPGTALDVAERALEEAKRRGIRVALNPSMPMLLRGERYARRVLRHVDVLLLNREEGSRLTGIPYAQPEKIFKRIDTWMPCIVLLTDGKRGAMLSDGVTVYRAGIFNVRTPQDETGAGDAFGSGFVAGLVQRLDKLALPVSRRREGDALCDIYPADAIRYALRAGSANAVSVIEHMGAKKGILTSGQLERPRWRNLRIHQKKL